MIFDPNWLRLFLVCGIAGFGLVAGCDDARTGQVAPVVVTERVAHDSDDPAIWIDPADSSHVLIVGTDKGGPAGGGGLYTFDLQGKIVGSVPELDRPNNVDVGYLGTTSVAVCTERGRHQLRVFRLPDLSPVDNGGIPVFEGESERDAMGIALYTEPTTKTCYAIVGRKDGPVVGYLWQYKLTRDSSGIVTAAFVRKFGDFSGRKEIESIAVDNELGYVYYSDEGVGVHKYYAHPDSGNRELALFATEGFAQDHEGISIYKHTDGTGFILVSNQQDDSFHVFPREGKLAERDSIHGDLYYPHVHELLKVIAVSTVESDGSDVTSRALPGFPKGLFVAMTEGGTFQYYRWEDFMKDENVNR